MKTCNTCKYDGDCIYQINNPEIPFCSEYEEEDDA